MRAMAPALPNIRVRQWFALAGTNHAKAASVKPTTAKPGISSWLVLRVRRLNASEAEIPRGRPSMSSNLLNITTALGATCVAVLLSTATARAADATAHKRDIRGFKLGMSQKDNLALRHQLCVVSPPNELRMYDPRREEEAHQQDWPRISPGPAIFKMERTSSIGLLRQLKKFIT